MKSKVCNTCNKRRLIKFFFKSKALKDGYRNMCKDCSAQAIRNYRANGKTTSNKYEMLSTRTLKTMLVDIRAELNSRGVLSE
jgi:superfamily II helicase